MLRLLVSTLFLATASQSTAHAQDWIDWMLVTNEDPISDRVTYSVFSQEDRYSPAFAYLACNEERTIVAFSDGAIIFHDNTFPKVTVRFDDREPRELLISNSRQNPTFVVNFDADVSYFAEGLRTASRLALRIDGGRTHSLSLRGASDAMAQLDQNCSVPNTPPEQ